MGHQRLQNIKQSSLLSDAFWDLCEFAVHEEPIPDWFILSPAIPFEIIGKDGSGGRYCLLNKPGEVIDRPVLYVNSEGSAGVFATSLDEAIQIMIALPYWQSCLEYSDGGKLVEMERAKVHLEKELHTRYSNLDELRRTMYAGVEFSGMPDPLAVLNSAVQKGSTLRVLAAKDRWPFNGLIKNLRIDKLG